MQFNKKKTRLDQNFDSITITLTSPDEILDRSYGEILKPETINYRSLKPERDGLFCERIFGPVKNYECHCGKYKRIRYKGIVCDRCGVEVTEKKVRRERMGHIKLVVPVVHIWFFKSLPNKIGYLLGFSSKNLETIIYYERYVVIQPGVKEGEVEVKDLLTEEEYLEILDNIPEDNHLLEDDDPNKFIAKMGGEAVYDLLARLDLESLSATLRYTASTETSQQRKSEALKRLRIVESFREGQKTQENRPEWTIIHYLPVIPPELRPLVPLDGGRFASSDLNDLYRRVIIRNNRLKRLLEIKAPEVILRNEKRMLQEAVDSLFDNSRKSNAVKAEGGRALKSLSDVLKGKRGRFRQNLLGKRVDYSGRSVIVVGPTLRLHECGLPKGMASELFKPFIIRKLIERGIVKTVKSAKKLVDKKDPIIWEILEYLLEGHPILLNRAPTLHRLSIQAFQPKLIEGKAIQLHPLVCGSFNADFDGDQMAVHVPLGKAAILEAQVLMLASHNMLNPQNGSPITLPSQDMVLGLYYLTKERPHKLTAKELPKFYSAEEVIIAFNEGVISIHDPVLVKVNAKGDGVMERMETTVGRVIFNEGNPDGIHFANVVMTKKNLKIVIGDLLNKTNFAITADFLDRIKELGFYWSFRGGLSFNLGDLINPSNRTKVLDEAQDKVDQIWESYEIGAITNSERYNQIIDVWTFADTEITRKLMDELAAHKDGFNSVYMMLHSGARGSEQQIKQLAGLRGLMAKPRKSGDTGGAVIENPILANFLEGLSVQEYFISTHGARKGLADTALKTADAGYLTRRLVDVAQDVVINIEDCGTLRGIEMTPFIENDRVVESLSDRIMGRYCLDVVHHPETREIILQEDEYVTKEKADLIGEAGIESVMVRSVLTCESPQGICKLCYGKNLATGRIAEKGDAVGVIAAQSIGEPGTQLTLRTFHVGGVASVSKAESDYVSKFVGTIVFDGIKTLKTEDSNGVEKVLVLSRTGEVKIIEDETEKELTVRHIQYGSVLHVNDGQRIKKGDIISSWDPFNAPIFSEFAGIAHFEDIVEGISFRSQKDELTGFSEKVVVPLKRGSKLLPTIKIVDKNGELLKSYSLPVGSHILIDDNNAVAPGQMLVKIPRQLGQIQDITGGLPRVTELFEARNPSNPAIISEIDGLVAFGKIKRGKREIIITAKDGQIRKYLVKLSKHILVQEGDFVKSGTALSDGAVTPRDILNIEGPFAVQQYLVNGVQDVYRSQGISINNKHMEVIVRQMMRRVEILDAGDTKFLEKEAVERLDFFVENDWIFDKKFIEDSAGSTKYKKGQIISLRKIREENSYLKRNDKKVMQFRDSVPATSKPILQGITRSSLGTPSWISAASFQETTKVLSKAVISAKKDTLNGLKENVICGKLIPAGTGLKDFRNFHTSSLDTYEKEQSRLMSFSDQPEEEEEEVLISEE